MEDWRERLNDFFQSTEQTKQHEEGTELPLFISGVVIPAFQQISEELKKHGRDVNIRNSMTSAAIIVQHDGEQELTYRIQGRTFPDRVLPCAEIRFRERKGLKLIRVESMFRSGEQDQDYRLSDITQEEIIRNFLEHYTQRVETD